MSHSWKYSEHYDSLIAWLSEEWNVDGIPLRFFDNSVPKDSPIHYANTDTELRNAIYKRIYDSNVVIIPTGMYANYSKWIKKEIDGAALYRKPVLAVNYRGSQRKSLIVGAASNQTVGWTKKSVVNGVWALYNETR